MDEILIIAVCLLFNAFFAAYEMAFVSLARSELRSKAKSGDKTALRLLTMRDNPERTLSIIQIGITLVGAIAAAVGGAGASESVEPYFIERFGMRELTAEILSVILVVLPITYLSVVIGELVPKTLALRAPSKVVFAGASLLFLADRALSPVITTFEWSTKKILAVFFKKSRPAEEHHSQTTLEIGELSPLHQSFVLNLVEIEKRRIKDIMVSWDQVYSVQKSSLIAEVTQNLIDSGYTRVPVTEEEQVVGILHTKEFVTVKESGETQWNSIIRPAVKVAPSETAFRVLLLMQETRSHMVVVVSASGKELGIVTMEDILEEVVGEIYDEDDDGKVRKFFAHKARARMRK